MAAGKIPVGVNIIASEQVTNVFGKVRGAIDKVFSSLNQGPKAASNALQATSKAVETTQAVVAPGGDKKPDWKNRNEKIIHGSGLGAFQRPAQMGISGIEGMASA